MKQIFQILFFLISVSAFGQASTITFQDKDNTLPTSDPRRLIRTVDVNEIKSVVNANAALLDLKATIIYTDAKVANSITNGVTTSAPNQDQVFDALALRALLASFVENEVPGGDVNSSNTIYTLANTPVAGSVAVYVNGLRFKNIQDYTISGGTITMVQAPQTGDNIICDYRK
jgi:hypothetical protein